MNENDSNRISAIDQFRGLAVILMVIANFTGGITGMPLYLKHAQDAGLTVIDLIAPFFIFAIGLTYRGSFLRRVSANGLFNAAIHFTKRFLAIAGIGAVFSAGALMADQPGGDWGVLQAIGAAGLICLPFIRFNTLFRLLVGIGLLAVYQLLLDKYWLQTVINSTHGGLPGSLGWGAMLILCTVFADLYYNPGHRGLKYISANVGILAAGIMASFFIVVSKHRVSLSYVLISIGASALLFYFFTLFGSKVERLFSPLEWWGRNPLVLYVLHQILLGVIVLPGIPAWYSEAPFWLTLCQLAFLMGLLTAISGYLYRKKIVIGL